MKTILAFAIILAALAGCTQRGADAVPVQPEPASAPDANPQGAGGGGHR